MVKRHFSDQPIWHQALHRKVSGVPSALGAWLLNSDSLTLRLQQASGGQLGVRVLNQSVQLPGLSERQALGLPPRRRALVREVVLFGRDTPWVYARSVLPLTTLTGPLRKLRHLDSRPLGELLFNDPTMTRGELEWACISADKSAALAPQLPLYEEPVWGRRSVFRLSGKPLLVCEIFLPSFQPDIY